jgi:hypothetical protein
MRLLRATAIFVCFFAMTLKAGAGEPPSPRGPASVKKATALAEKMLLHFNKNEFAKAHALMTAKIQKLITAAKLGEETQKAYAVVGLYLPGTLKLKKQIKAKNLFLFEATFKKDKGTATMMLAKNGKVAAFVLSSPKLIKAFAPKIKLTVAMKKSLGGIVNKMMKGYNEKKWGLFSSDFTKAMKKALKARFAKMCKTLMASHGKYLSSAFFKTHKMKKKNYLIVLYIGKFAKKRAYIRVVFEPKGKKHLIAGILFPSTPPPPAQK